eukprot:COSAG06_NODE_55953_length_287_cov_0.803191_1_plen_38_part_10
MYMGWHGNKCDHQQEHNTKCMTYSCTYMLAMCNALLVA